MNICHWYWFNKEARRSIAGQDKVKQESQTKDHGEEEGRSQRSLEQMWSVSVLVIWELAGRKENSAYKLYISMDLGIYVLLDWLLIHYNIYYDNHISQSGQ